MPAKKTEIDHIGDAKARILAAALPNVVFDGWTKALLDEAILSAKVDAGLAAQALPRGVIDLLVYFHKAGDAAMSAADLPEGLNIRGTITHLVKSRLEGMAGDKDAIRKALSFWALPGRQFEGGQLVWGTADAIWTKLGDPSTDLNWYTKRATLAGVYSSTLLFWLGDESDDHAESWAFLDRRIGDVMRFEKFKSGVQKSPVGGLYDALFSAVKKPKRC